MATNPDPHPDSPPAGPAEAPDQLSPIEEPGRDSEEGRSPIEDPDIPRDTDHQGETR